MRGRPIVPVRVLNRWRMFNKLFWTYFLITLLSKTLITLTNANLCAICCQELCGSVGNVDYPKINAAILPQTLVQRSCPCPPLQETVDPQPIVYFQPDKPVSPNQPAGQVPQQKIVPPIPQARQINTNLPPNQLPQTFQSIPNSFGQKPRGFGGISQQPLPPQQPNQPPYSQIPTAPNSHTILIPVPTITALILKPGLMPNTIADQTVKPIVLPATQQPNQTGNNPTDLSQKISPGIFGNFIAKNYGMNLGDKIREKESGGAENESGFEDTAEGGREERDETEKQYEEGDDEVEFKLATMPPPSNATQVTDDPRHNNATEGLSKEAVEVLEKNSDAQTQNFTRTFNQLIEEIRSRICSSKMNASEFLIPGSMNSTNVTVASTADVINQKVVKRTDLSPESGTFHTDVPTSRSYTTEEPITTTGVYVKTTTKVEIPDENDPEEKEGTVLPENPYLTDDSEDFKNVESHDLTPQIESGTSPVPRESSDQALKTEATTTEGIKSTTLASNSQGDSMDDQTNHNESIKRILETFKFHSKSFGHILPRNTTVTQSENGDQSELPHPNLTNIIDLLLNQTSNEEEDEKPGGEPTYSVADQLENLSVSDLMLPEPSAIHANTDSELLEFLNQRSENLPAIGSSKAMLEDLKSQLENDKSSGGNHTIDGEDQSEESLRIGDEPKIEVDELKERLAKTQPAYDNRLLLSQMAMNRLDNAKFGRIVSEKMPPETPNDDKKKFETLDPTTITASIPNQTVTPYPTLLPGTINMNEAGTKTDSTTFVSLTPETLKSTFPDPEIDHPFAVSTDGPEHSPIDGPIVTPYSESSLFDPMPVHGESEPLIGFSPPVEDIKVQRPIKKDLYNDRIKDELSVEQQLRQGSPLYGLGNSLVSTTVEPPSTMSFSTTWLIPTGVETNDGKNMGDRMSKINTRHTHSRDTKEADEWLNSGGKININSLIFTFLLFFTIFINLW